MSKAPGKNLRRNTGARQGFAARAVSAVVVAALSLAGCQSGAADQAEPVRPEVPVEKTANKLVWQVEQNGSAEGLGYPEVTVQAPVLTAEQEEANYAVTNALLEYVMAVDLLEEYFLTDPATVSAETLSALEQAAYDALSDAGRAAQWAEMLVEESYYASSGSRDTSAPADSPHAGDVLLDPDTAFSGEPASLAPGLFSAEEGADTSSVDIWATDYAEMVNDGTPGRALSDFSGMIAEDTLDLSVALGDYATSGDRGSADLRELAWRTAKGVARVGLATATIGVVIAGASSLGVVGGFAGGIAVAVAGGDILFEVGSGVANVTMGFGNNVTAAISEAQRALAPIGFVVNLAGATSVEGALTFIGPVGLDLSEGTVAGFRISGNSVSYVDVTPGAPRGPDPWRDQLANTAEDEWGVAGETLDLSTLDQIPGGSELFGSDLFGGSGGSAAELAGNWSAKIGSGVGAEDSTAVIREQGGNLSVSIGAGRYPEFTGSFNSMMSIYAGQSSSGTVLELQFDMERSPITAWGMLQEASGNIVEVELTKN